ncbi:fungal hydrophobin-domain-containing protein [Lyophyllum atratum]|nr:fungal hydrophobin-domain-containing protein [Lyophyllum atratum]
MFAPVSAILLALPLLAAALPANQCNTGTTACCNELHNANDQNASGLLGLLGISVKDIIGQVGFGCSPLSAAGIAGNSCTAQPVCCTGNHFSGLVVVGCSPININM